MKEVRIVIGRRCRRCAIAAETAEGTRCWELAQCLCTKHPRHLSTACAGGCYLKWILVTWVVCSLSLSLNCWESLWFTQQAHCIAAAAGSLGFRQLCAWPFRSFKIPMNIPAAVSDRKAARRGAPRRGSAAMGKKLLRDVGLWSPAACVEQASLRSETSPKESNHGGWSKCPRNRDELATSLGSPHRILMIRTIVRLIVIKVFLLCSVIYISCLGRKYL